VNIEEIKQILVEIERKSGDEERAHILEDDLFCEFVLHIANDTFEGDIKEGAKEVLKSLDIEFDRWYA